MSHAALTRLLAALEARPALRAALAAPGLSPEAAQEALRAEGLSADPAMLAALLPLPGAALDEALLDGFAGGGRGLAIQPPPVPDTTKIIEL
ncbi:hypothetical protein [Pseudoroseomonas cervicalis]|uniref:hypothetical protein n=1 Tax=Teichococcus cervicalis TaxID=204525 RepID=UPI0022F1CF63|nr:hypothetical protein [Pseudoroseomonas cervicalis]WBV42195.1 hypothetical protein PFY06_13255 [Pseudoroseomonas cervicalis]